MINGQETEKIFANPFYCLPKIHEVFSQKHEPMVSEEEFIKAVAILIQEIGPEKYIKLLLEAISKLAEWTLIFWLAL